MLQAGDGGGSLGDDACDGSACGVAISIGDVGHGDHDARGRDPATLHGQQAEAGEAAGGPWQQSLGWTEPDRLDLVGRQQDRPGVARPFGHGDADRMGQQQLQQRRGGGTAQENTQAIQPDGKILEAGTYQATPSTEQGFVLRFNPDGTPDDTFGNHGFVSTSISPIASMPRPSG